LILRVDFLAYRYKYKPKRSKSKRIKFRKSLKKNKLLLLGVSAVFVVAIIAITVYLFLASSKTPFPIITGLSTLGYKKVSVDAAVINNQGIVTLTSGCYQILAYVETHQAESIIMGIEGIVPARPNAHDIAVDAFESLGIELLIVKVTELRNNTFYGKLILKSGNRVASLDARPSDATAIAIRMDVPIYVKDGLLKEYGEYIC